ncbi:MAG: response regulator [Acidimicrobiales bacterium]
MLRRRQDIWDGSERRSPALVLIVNEDPDACEMLVRMVATRGYETIGATSDDEAGSRLVGRLPRCVVLDVHSGGVGTNLKLLDKIRSHEDRRISTARVVLCAASPKNRSFSFQSGADSFLVRPFHLDELVAQITDVLGRAHQDRARHRRDELIRHGD